jgi:hypothetical protein
MVDVGDETASLAPYNGCVSWGMGCLRSGTGRFSQQQWLLGFNQNGSQGGSVFMQRAPLHLKSSIVSTVSRYDFLEARVSLLAAGVISSVGPRGGCGLRGHGQRREKTSPAKLGPRPVVSPKQVCRSRICTAWRWPEMWSNEFANADEFLQIMKSHHGLQWGEVKLAKVSCSCFSRLLATRLD